MIESASVGRLQSQNSKTSLPLLLLLLTILYVDRRSSALLNALTTLMSERCHVSVHSSH